MQVFRKSVQNMSLLHLMSNVTKQLMQETVLTVTGTSILGNVLMGLPVEWESGEVILPSTPAQVRYQSATHSTMFKFRKSACLIGGRVIR